MYSLLIHLFSPNAIFFEQKLILFNQLYQYTLISFILGLIFALSKTKRYSRTFSVNNFTFYI